MTWYLYRAGERVPQDPIMWDGPETDRARWKLAVVGIRVAVQSDLVWHPGGNTAEPAMVDLVDLETRVTVGSIPKPSAPACQDCGSEPIWKYADLCGYSYYCQRCTRKNGHMPTICVELDDAIQAIGLEAVLRLWQPSKGV